MCTVHTETETAWRRRRRLNIKENNYNFIALFHVEECRKDSISGPSAYHTTLNLIFTRQIYFIFVTCFTTHIFKQEYRRFF